MENIEIEFLDRAVSLIKQGYPEEAAQLIYNESNLTLGEARTTRDLLTTIIE
jgi:hypothetical protein